MDGAVPAAPAAQADDRETGRPDDDGVSECCRRAWLAALTLAENLLLDEVYDRVQRRSPHDAVRECVFAIRGLKEIGRAAWACQDWRTEWKGGVEHMPVTTGGRTKAILLGLLAAGGLALLALAKARRAGSSSADD